MKRLKVLIVCLVLLAAPASLLAGPDKLQPYKDMVDKSDAVQAMALANQWKWTNSDIVTHVTPQEVTFEFPDNTVKKVALPADKMVVAIAPYLTYTHG